MAKAVSYTINAKDKTKAAINSAKGGLDGFKGSLGAMKGVLGAAFSVVAIKKAADMIGGLTDTYGVQQGAELKLSAAAKNNPLLNGDAVARLNAHASAMQGVSIYGDEQIIEMEAGLAAQGRTEAQIKAIMEASIDLASSGVMPLDSAMKNLSKTYAGSAGELAESIPALKDLTKEQMANGDAVAIVASQYKGMGAAVAGGVAGTKQQLANLKGDIQESLGEIFVGITGDANKKLLPVFTKINEWLQGNKNKIINIFQNIPQVAQTTFNLIKSLAAQILSVEFWVQFGGIMWKSFLQIGKTAIGVMFEFLKAIGSVFWEPLKYGFQFIVADFKVLFANLINFFVDKINYFMGLYNKLADSKAGKFLGAESATLLERKDVEAIAYPENKIKDNIKEAFGNAFEKLNDAGGEIVDTFKDTLSGVMEMGGELFSDEFKIFTDDMTDIVNTPLSLDTSSTTTGTGTTGTGGTVLSPAGSSGLDLGGVLDGGLDKLSGFMDITGQLGGMFTKLISGLSSVTALLNWGGVIIDGVLNIIAGPVNELLKPLVGLLVIVGQTLGKMLIPILNLLTPSLTFLTLGLIHMFNYGIRPLANAFIFVAVQFNNAMAWAINGIIQLINSIPFVNISWRMKTLSYEDNQIDSISTDDLQNSGDSYLGANGGTGYSTGAGASYSQARDIYLTFNIDYQVGISAFDDNDLAVKIYEQIERSKTLGLIA